MIGFVGWTVRRQRNDGIRKLREMGLASGAANTPTPPNPTKEA